MSIIVIDGFDLYNGVGASPGVLAKWTQYLDGSGTNTLPAGRYGGQAFRMLNGDIWTRGVTSGSAFAVGFAAKYSSLAGMVSVQPQIGFASNANINANIQFGVSVASTGAIEVRTVQYYNNTGTQVGISAAGVIVANTWHYIEIECTIGNTGSITVYVDGTAVLTIPSGDIMATAAATSDTFFIQPNTGAGNTLDVDDLYICSGATRLGERRVETIYPTADTADKDFTRSTGSDNYALVDEAVCDTTDYVSGSTVGDFDLYTMGDLSSSPATVDAVQLTCFANKTDAGTRSIALTADLSGTQVDSSNLSLASGVTKHDAIMATKPGGGSWSAANVNSLKAGVKVTV